MTDTIAIKLENRYGSGLYDCGFVGESITGKKTSTRNAINASLALDVVHRRAAARTLGAMPIARRGNWSTPSKIRN